MLESPNPPASPRVSCIIAAYNASAYLRDAINSLQRQTYENIEIIVVDDGSTDETANIAESAAVHDKRVRIMRIANSKQAIARNTGIDKAKGEFIANLDADDLAMPTRIERQLAFLQEHAGYVAVGGAIRLIDCDGCEIGVDVLPTTHVTIADNLRNGNPGAGLILSASMVRKACLQAIGGFRPEFVPAEDYDLWLRLIEVGRLANLGEVVTEYRVHFDSDSSTKAAIQLSMAQRARAEALKRNNLPQPRFRLSGIVTVQPLDRVLAVYTRFGRHDEAFRLLWREIRAAPLRRANLVSLVRWIGMLVSQKCSLGRRS